MGVVLRAMQGFSLMNIRMVMVVRMPVMIIQGRKRRRLDRCRGSMLTAVKRSQTGREQYRDGQCIMCQR